VTFAGDYFTLTTHTDATTPDKAETAARQLLLDHYGYDMAETAHDVETVRA
jgi:hypothetical protein